MMFAWGRSMQVENPQSEQLVRDGNVSKQEYRRSDRVSHWTPLPTLPLVLQQR